MNLWQSSSLLQQQHQDKTPAREIASSTNAWEVSSLQTTGITSIRFGCFSKVIFFVFKRRLSEAAAATAASPLAHWAIFAVGCERGRADSKHDYVAQQTINTVTYVY
jgi:hypothetical protein